MKRKRDTNALHLRAETLHTAYIGGSKCDVRYNADVGLYDLCDLLKTCIRSNRVATDLVSKWSRRDTEDGPLSSLRIGENDASKAVIWSYDADSQFKRPQRQRATAAVSASAAFEILTYCDSIMFDSRIVGMRRLMKKEHCAWLTERPQRKLKCVKSSTTIEK